MDLKQLEYFVHIAELGSFTRAASFLSVAQPALSRQVRLLEVELRQTLLLRNGRGVSLTDAGKRLLAHGVGILQQVERAKQELEETQGAPVGRVAVGVPPTVGRALSVRLVAEFQRHFPKATLGIVEGMSTYIAEWLNTGRVDIGLLYNPLPSPGIETLPLLEEQLYLISPVPQRAARKKPAASIRLTDLPQFPLIIPSRPHAMRMYVETQMANAGLKMNVAWEIDGIAAILDLVQQGYGHAVLPLMAARGDAVRSNLAARPILRPRLASALALATSSQRPQTPLTRCVVDLLRELVPACLNAARTSSASARNP